MTEFQFRFEWEAAEGVSAPELRATWARLEVWVGPDCVSYLEDRTSSSARRSLYGALYPLAEWIAYNWWFLHAHTRPARLGVEALRYANRLRGSQTTSRWLAHHNMRGAGDGQSWPDLAILPQGNTTRLVWHADRRIPDHVPVRFLSDGEAVAALSDVETACAHLVEAVLTRLDESGVADTRLATEWSAIQETDGEEREFCLAAARLGLDPYAIDDEAADLIVRVGHELAPELHDDFFGSVNPEHLDEGVQWVREADRQVAQANGTRAGAIEELRRNAPDAHRSVRPARPWESGYARAASVRHALGVAPTDRLELGDFVLSRGLHAVDQGLHGLGGLSDDASPVLVADPDLPQRPRRFLEARALWHLLDRPDERRFLIVSAYTERQQAERAFAAELLAPAEGVAAHLAADADDPVHEEQLDRVARAFGVSPTLVRHQIENQLGRVVTSAY